MKYGGYIKMYQEFSLQLTRDNKSEALAFNKLCISSTQLQVWLFQSLKDKNRPKYVQFHTHYMKTCHKRLEASEEMVKVGMETEDIYLQVCSVIKDEIGYHAYLLECYDRMY